MYRNPEYHLIRLGESDVLIPAGQMQADLRHCLYLNSTARRIWEEMEMAQSRSQLLSRLLSIYQPDETEQKEFENDIDSFVDQFIDSGLLIEEPQNDLCFDKALSIAGIHLLLSGRSDAFSQDFSKFWVDPASIEFPDQLITITENTAPKKEGICLFKSPFLSVTENLSGYQLEFPDSAGITSCFLSKSGRNVDFYVQGPFDEALRYDIFHGIRSTFFYLAEKRKMFALHSASLLYKDKIWLFSGPSGTGKSTHTRLWNQYVHTPLINGDLNLISLSRDHTPVVRGIPWCGTSQICDRGDYPLGGIVLLNQDSTNSIQHLSEYEQHLAILHRIISPEWNLDQITQITGLLNDLIPQIPVFRLNCTISEEAVQVVRHEIDHCTQQFP